MKRGYPWVDQGVFRRATHNSVLMKYFYINDEYYMKIFHFLINFEQYIRPITATLFLETGRVRWRERALESIR